jgi:hypothetical protein
MLRELESKGLIVVVMMAIVAAVVIWAVVVSVPLWVCDKVCGKLGIIDEHDLE